MTRPRRRSMRSTASSTRAERSPSTRRVPVRSAAAAVEAAVAAATAAAADAGAATAAAAADAAAAVIDRPQSSANYEPGDGWSPGFLLRCAMEAVPDLACPTQISIQRCSLRPSHPRDLPLFKIEL